MDYEGSKWTGTVKNGTGLPHGIGFLDHRPNPNAPHDNGFFTTMVNGKKHGFYLYQNFGDPNNYLAQAEMRNDKNNGYFQHTSDGRSHS